MMPSNHASLTRDLRVGEAACGAASALKQVRANSAQTYGGGMPLVREFVWQDALLPSGDGGLVRSGEAIPRAFGGGRYDH